jgi:magnesium chelatase family protein
MSYAQTRAIGLVGLQGYLVTVEADIRRGLPAILISGLPDASLHEARDRVRAAILNSGAAWPQTRITLNLLPAELPKRGTSFDLSIAVALLAAAEIIPRTGLARAAFIGELGLDGRVRPVRGVLPMVLAAAREGLRRIIVPAANASEAQLVPAVTVGAAGTLRQVIDVLRGEAVLPEVDLEAAVAEPDGPDLMDVVGQERGRYALEVAAAGGHNLALFGPPGAGKTMLAQRLPSILPPLDDEAALEVTAVHSLAGALPSVPQLIRRPPFQAPHHSASAPALVGGGSGLARPGALSLAHNGVLFLDEAPEFSPYVLNALRQPLEEGWVTLVRTGGSARYPAQIQLVLASNPCPCGTANDLACSCSPQARRRYQARLPGPLMDRVDLRVQLPPVDAAALDGADSAPEPSAAVLERVLRARAAAAQRWAGKPFQRNARIPGAVLRKPPFRLPRVTTAELVSRVERGALSARGYDRVLRIAWSIADLGGRPVPDTDDVNVAIELRTGELV